MRKIFTISCLLLCGNSSAAPMSIFMNGYSDNYTPSVPVADFFGSWKGAKSYKRADRAYANEFVQLGVKTNSYSISLFYRYDYNVEMHPDVAEYRYTFHNNRDALEDRDYIYKLYEQRLTSHGIRLGYSHSFKNTLDFNVFVNILTSNKFQQREIKNGHQNGLTQLGDADTRYYFSEDTLYKLVDTPDSSRGYGASLDLYLKYKLYTYDLFAEVKDIGHFIHWSDSPYAIGQFGFDKYSYDANHVRNQQPLANINTSEGGKKRDFTINLPLRANLGIRKNFDSGFNFGGRYCYNEIYNHSVIDIGYNFANGTVIESGFNLRTHAISLYGKHNGYFVKLLTDDLKLGYANHLSIFAGIEVNI